MSTNVTWNEEPEDRRGVFKLLTAAAWAAGSLGGFVVVVMWAYHLGASSPADIPAISAKGDYRIEPINPGGTNVSGQELAAYGDIDGHASAEEQRAVLAAVAERPKTEDRPVASEQIETGSLTAYVARGAAGDEESAAQLLALDTMRSRQNEVAPGFEGAPENISLDGQRMSGFVTPGSALSSEPGEKIALAEPAPSPIGSQTQTVETAAGDASSGSQPAETGDQTPETPQNSEPPAAETPQVAAQQPEQEIALAGTAPPVPPVEVQDAEPRRLNLGTPRDSTEAPVDNLGGEAPVTEATEAPLDVAPAPLQRPQRENTGEQAASAEPPQPTEPPAQAPTENVAPTLGVLGQVPGAKPINLSTEGGGQTTEQRISQPPAPSPSQPPAQAPAQPQQATQSTPAPTPAAPQQQAPQAAPPRAAPASIPTPVAQNAPGLAPFAVQIAALETPDAVAVRWGQLQVRAPDLLAERDLVIQETALIDPASQQPKTMYRLRVGFPSSVSARNFCLKLRERGIDCYSSPMNR